MRIDLRLGLVLGSSVGAQVLTFKDLLDGVLGTLEEAGRRQAQGR
jgi:hypothetical protein